MIEMQAARILLKAPRGDEEAPRATESTYNYEHIRDWEEQQLALMRRSKGNGKGRFERKPLALRDRPEREETDAGGPCKCANRFKTYAETRGPYPEVSKDKRTWWVCGEANNSSAQCQTRIAWGAKSIIEEVSQDFRRLGGPGP